MAGDWIKMRTDLADDPAVIAIAAAVGVDEDAVVGKLHRLWSWADQQSRDGHATGVTSSWVDRKVSCAGFAGAMVSAGWLEITAAGLAIPDFDKHNGEPGKVRALGTRRKQRQRANEPPPGATQTVTPIVPESSRQTSRSDRDKSETREEKRREEATPPISPPKAKAAKRRNRKAEGSTFDEWVDSCKLEDIPRIPPDDPVRKFASSAGIPDDFLHLAWISFRERYAGKAERYINWRQHFGDYVRRNWHKLWWVNPQGQYALTTVGEQLRRVTEVRRKEESSAGGVNA